jgi:lambda repressor-like predicted transcriptional regulator
VKSDRRACPPRGALPVPGAPGFVVSPIGDVWRSRGGSGRALNHNAKLTPELVELASRLRGEGATLQAIGDRLGVSLTAVRLALQGATWAEWSKCHTFPIGGAGRFVRLVIAGRTVIRSVEILLRAANDLDPSSWAARISGTVPRRKAEPRPPRPVRPPALPRSAPPCPLSAMADRGPPVPRPAGPPVRLEAEPLDAAELVARGERNGRARLTDAQVVEARALRTEGWTLAALAARYGVSPGTLGYATRADGTGTWSHLPAD